MNSKLRKSLLALTIAASLAAFSASTSAYTNCKWVNGYRANGYYHHGHKVCWSGHHKHCGWRNGHRVCWY